MAMYAYIAARWKQAGIDGKLEGRWPDLPLPLDKSNTLQVLLSISSLLTDANPDDPLVPEIAHIYKRCAVGGAHGTWVLTCLLC